MTNTDFPLRIPR